MREIKFRAWDKREKRMVIVLAIAFNTNFLHYALDNSWGVKYGKSYWSDIHNFELMQFTGSRDKNGKEIWEGDIVKNSFGSLYIIRWVGCMMGFKGEPLYVKNEVSDVEASDLEVIGNIYENPELLGGQQ